MRTLQHLFPIENVPLSNTELKAKMDSVSDLKQFILQATNEHCYLKYSKHLAYQKIVNYQLNQGLGTVILMHL